MYSIREKGLLFCCFTRALDQNPVVLLLTSKQLVDASSIPSFGLVRHAHSWFANLYLPSPWLVVHWWASFLGVQQIASGHEIPTDDYRSMESQVYQGGRCLWTMKVNTKVICADVKDWTLQANLAGLGSLHTPHAEVTSKRDFKERVHRLECRAISWVRTNSKRWMCNMKNGRRTNNKRDRQTTVN